MPPGAKSKNQSKITDWPRAPSVYRPWTGSRRLINIDSLVPI
jgi:hypothetical protein